MGALGILSAAHFVQEERNQESPPFDIALPLPNGSSWSGITQPPSPDQRRINDHPRILLTPETLPSLRRKLRSAVYQKDIEALRKSDNPTDKAFRYVVFGDRRAGVEAKNALLANEIPRWSGLDQFIVPFQAALMYDWLYHLMSPEERKLSAEVVMFHAKTSEGSLAEYFRSNRSSKPPQTPYYWNDVWSRGLAFQTVAGLALDNKWATNLRNDAYDGREQVFGPYSGGAIDVLNTMSLTSGGGQQAGILDQAGSGYEAFFQIGASFFLHSWQTATSENVVEMTTYFETLPKYLAQSYLHVKEFDETAKQSLEYATGNRDPDSASLAAWLLREKGRARYALVPRLILGDLRVRPRSPVEVNLPNCDYLEGADLFYSRTGWEKQNTVLLMYARHWDTNRYEPSSGCLAIYQSGLPILVLGTQRKGTGDPTRTSGVWAWNRNDPKTIGFGSTYWRDLRMQAPRRAVPRAFSARDVVATNNSFYRPETLVDQTVTEQQHSATTSFASLLKCKGVEQARRTVSRRMPAGKIIQVTDEFIAEEGVNFAISLRLTSIPKIHDNVIQIPGARITLESETTGIQWYGGQGSELNTPWGGFDKDIHKGQKSKYAENAERVREWGLGDLFITPKREGRKTVFRWIIEVQ